MRWAGRFETSVCIGTTPSRNAVCPHTGQDADRTIIQPEWRYYDTTLRRPARVGALVLIIIIFIIFIINVRGDGYRSMTGGTSFPCAPPKRVVRNMTHEKAQYKSGS